MSETPERRMRGGRRGRQALLVAAAALLAAASFLFLPAGVFRLALQGALALPILLTLLYSPRAAFFVLAFVAFSNIDIFAPVPVFAPLSGLVVLALAFDSFRGRRIVITERPFNAILIAMLIVAFQSMAVTSRLGGSIDKFINFAGVCLLAFLSVEIVRTRRDLAIFFAVVAAALAFSDFVPFVIPPPETYSSRSLLWGEGVLRYEGYATEPNFFALQQIFLLPVLFCLFAISAGRMFLRTALLVLAAGSVFVLVLSFSRGGFVSLAVMIAALLVAERRNRALVASALAAAVLAVLAAPPAYWPRILDIFDVAERISADYAVFVRIETMKTALAVGIGNPLFGAGIGNFIAEASRYIPFAKDAHNSFLQILSETGLPGLAVLVVLLAWNLRTLWRLKGSADPLAARIGRLLLVQQAGFAAAAMLIPAGFDFVFWITMALPSVAAAAYGGPERSAPSRA